MTTQYAIETTRLNDSLNILSGRIHKITTADPDKITAGQTDEMAQLVQLIDQAILKADLLADDIAAGE